LRDGASGASEGFDHALYTHARDGSVRTDDHGASCRRRQTAGTDLQMEICFLWKPAAGGVTYWMERLGEHAEILQRRLKSSQMYYALNGGENVAVRADFVGAEPLASEESMYGQEKRLRCTKLSHKLYQ
jgi:hypothetical protein